MILPTGRFHDVLKTFKKMKIIITLYFVFGAFISFSQQITSKKILTANNPILSHEALMDKLLERVPKKENSLGKSWQGKTNTFPFQKSAKLLAATAYCNCQVPLAVLDIDLTATRIDAENVKLNWKTTGEQNSQGFEIERSIDVSKFEVRGFLKSNNNSENKNEYQHIDKNKNEGLTYYRIKEIDQNGKVMYSKIVAVDGFPNENNIKLFPNPVSDFVKLQIHSNQTETGQLTILSSIGKQITQQNINLAVGMNSKKIDIADIPAGIYFMKILIGNKKDKIIKFSKN